MNKPAYDEIYLEAMLLKTRYLFKLIARNCPDAFSVIQEYMRSDYRKYMDSGNPLYLNKTPKQILGNMGITVQKTEEPNERYDEFVLEWMADVYTYMQWKYGIASTVIVEEIRPEELYKKYNPLHEASLRNGVGKLRQIYGI